MAGGSCLLRLAVIHTQEPVPSLAPICFFNGDEGSSLYVRMWVIEDCQGAGPMNELDKMIALLREEPLPGALCGIDHPVMAGLVAGRERLSARRGVALACGVAAVVGLWGGLSMPVERHRHTHVEPLLGMPAAAPSHLLAS